MADVTITAVPTTMANSGSLQSHLGSSNSTMGHNNDGTATGSTSASLLHPGTKSAGDSNSVPPAVVLTKQRLQELINEIDPCEQLDEEAEDMILQMADDFVETLVASSCQIAKHRGSKSLEVRDVQLVLEKNFNMNIPGFGNTLTGLNRLKSHSSTTEAHKQRMALIKKTLKKF